MRVLLKNLRIPEGENSTRPASILIEGEKIREILPEGAGPEVDRIEEMGNGLLIPAAIDPHVHFDDPGYTHREDFFTGTRAAAAGGVGMVVDMPCTSVPEITSPANMKKKLASIGPRALVDFMLWGGLSSQCLENPGWREDADALIGEGVAAFKCYLISGMESFGALDRDSLAKVFSWARTAGIPIGVHAEDPEIIDQNRSRLQASGEDSLRAYAASRPAESEISAMRLLINLCRQSGARVHVVHLASAEALELLKAARSEGLPISAETCPHYLLFTVEDLIKMGSLLKTAPVLKSARDREGLWRGLSDGDLLYLASDHAAAKWPEEKSTGSAWSDYGGIPGVELLLSTLYSEGYRKDRISLSRLVELSSTAAAGFLGIDQRKGRLEQGYDADFALIDEEATRVVRATELHNKNRYTPLEGRCLQGLVVQTWVRGKRIFHRKADGSEEFAPAGTGRWIRREGQE